MIFVEVFCVGMMEKLCNVGITVLVGQCCHNVGTGSKVLQWLFNEMKNEIERNHILFKFLCSFGK